MECIHTRMKCIDQFYPVDSTSATDILANKLKSVCARKWNPISGRSSGLGSPDSFTRPSGLGKPNSFTRKQNVGDGVKKETICDCSADESRGGSLRSLSIYFVWLLGENFELRSASGCMRCRCCRQVCHFPGPVLSLFSLKRNDLPIPLQICERDVIWISRSLRTEKIDESPTATANHRVSAHSSYR